jgi:hypothetical protein
VAKRCGFCTFTTDDDNEFARHMATTHAFAGTYAAPMPTAGGMQPVLVRLYKGSQDQAMQAFQRDASVLAPLGYVPMSQSWAPGSWGCGAFLVALLLCIVLVGIVVFIYLLVVKPPGTLTVTYHLQQKPAGATG